MDPSRVDGGRRRRVLHEHYPASDTYRALFLAALSMAETSVVDRLVTGLPTKQWQDPSRRGELIRMMTGAHVLGGGRTVQVDEVYVVPQPMGGFIDYVACLSDPMSVRDVLIIDPGFFSIDWVVVRRSEIQQTSSSSSTLAMSVAIERAVGTIKEETGRVLARERLEEAIIRSDPYLVAGSSQVDFRPHVERAVAEVANQAATEIRDSLRLMGVTPDVVVLVGGGATWYRSAIRDIYGKLVDVVIPRNPQFANARGYYRIGAA
ncbi:MAG: ParM/StbA family protein [Chromatiales bacterium]|nr:ParM/StbA family protein [Chromatiales bacterium]